MYNELVKKSLQKEANNLNKLETKFEVENSIISISNILKECSERCFPPKRKNKNKGKLQIWTEAISNAYKEMRQANNNWYEAGKPHINHPTTQLTKKCKQIFRSIYRTEIALQELSIKEKIMTTRTRDSKTFHLLLNRQPKSLRGFIQDLHVDDEILTGEQNIMEGFHKHFKKLATTAADSEYKYNLSEIVIYENDIIHELTKGKNIPTPTQKEVKNAIESIRKGKAAYIFNIAIEHFLYGGEELSHFVHKIIIAIFQSGVVPNIVKVGLLSPVFKS